MPALLYSKRKIGKNMVVTENDINEGNNNTSEVKRFKILIIDDSEKNRGELTEMLEMHHFYQLQKEISCPTLQLHSAPHQ